MTGEGDITSGPPSDSPAPVGMRFASLLSVLVGCAFAVTAVAFDASGRHARWRAPEASPRTTGRVGGLEGGGAMTRRFLWILASAYLAGT